MRYRWLRTLHLWLSLATALPLLLLSLTGALLVYGHELQRLLQPSAWTVEVPAPGAEPLPFETLVARLAEQKPEVRVWSFGLNDNPEAPWTLWLADGGGVINLDPYSGRVVDHYRQQDSLYGIVVGLHRRWLTGSKSVTPWIRHFISAVSLVLILQMLVGLWMWLLPPKRLARLKVDFARSPRAVVLRLHQLSGVVTAVLLAVVAFTGMSLYWHGPIQRVVEAATGQEVADQGNPEFGALAPIRDLDAAIAVGRAAFPDSRLKHFRMPRAGEPVMLGLKPDDALAVSRVWVGDDPPRLLASETGADQNAATWFWRLRYPIHIGDFAGPVVRALWVIVALLPAAFVVSGLWLHLDRRSRARAGRRTRRAEAAASRA
ncbi:MAG: PepSY-associated TM helix domain-containing protein [Tistlia sp.]|uniref:PepSY-associated TM helix domain-containing protein n=1 Tax=Tistlia sp. TaxID=3057121 RepID=UPI0034A2B8B9